MSARIPLDPLFVVTDSDGIRSHARHDDHALLVSVG